MPGPDFLCYKYFLKVVPTEFYSRLGESLVSFRARVKLMFVQA